MTHLDAAGRATALMANGAHELNEELSIIFSSIVEVQGMLSDDDPARPLLVAALAASQRCAWKASAMLNFAARRNVRPSAASLDSLIEHFGDKAA